MITRWWWRFRAGLSLAAILLIAAAAPALAAEDESSPSGAMLDMFGITTSDGLKLSQQELAIETRFKAFGQDLPDPFLMIINTIWFVYRVLIGFCLWFLRQAQTGSWRSGLIDAIDSTVSPFLQQLHDLNLPTVVAAAATIVAAWLFARGRSGAALGELGVIMVAFSLSVGILATPVGEFTEPGGYLDESFTVARGLTAGINEEQSEDGKSVGGTEARMADILVGQPAQLMSFGELLSKKCSKAHVKALKKHAGKDEAEDVRKAVAKCDDRYEEPMFLEAVFGIGIFLWPFLVTIGAASVLLSLLTIFLVAALIWYSAAISWHAIWGIFPGKSREKLIHALINAGLSLAGLVIVLVVSAVASQGLVEFFDSVRGEDAGLLDTFRAYSIASFVMSLLWMMLWWKVLKALLTSKGKAKKATQTVSPSKPASVPSGGGALSRLGSGAMSAAGTAAGAHVAKGGGSTPPAGSPAPTGQPAPAGVPSSAGVKSSSGGMKKGVASATTKVAAGAALAAATGGTSTIASTAGRATTKVAAQAGQRRLSEHMDKSRGQSLKEGPATTNTTPPGQIASVKTPTGPSNTAPGRPGLENGEAAPQTQQAKPAAAPTGAPKEPYRYPDLEGRLETPPPPRRRGVPPSELAELRERLYGDTKPRPTFAPNDTGDTAPLSTGSWTQPLSKMPTGAR